MKINFLTYFNYPISIIFLFSIGCTGDGMTRSRVDSSEPKKPQISRDEKQNNADQDSTVVLGGDSKPAGPAGQDQAVKTTSKALMEEKPVIDQTSCNKAGKVYIPITSDTGGSAVCGEPLVGWPCCEAMVLAKFPAYAEDLKIRFEERKTMKLYNCGKKVESTTLHWMSTDGKGTVEYKTSTIPMLVSDTPDPNVKCE
ncbi:MAG: hypothetical protein HQK54_06965 [Oligoflexales bacterium]|nr:hypothetical protein [Oligoflexales bacterium]